MAVECFECETENGWACRVGLGSILSLGVGLRDVGPKRGAWWERLEACGDGALPDGRGGERRWSRASWLDRRVLRATWGCVCIVI